ncbi:MAG: hypothetical protein WC389_16595 [Lutibacter sp.]|jgi:hypothetical protein
MIKKSTKEIIQEKLDNLKIVVNEYLPFVDQWHKVDVDYDKFTAMVTVTWYNEVEKENQHGERNVYYPYTKREFHISDIDSRIKRYKDKIAKAIEDQSLGISKPARI